MKKWILYFWLIVASFGMAGCSEENYFEESLGEEWNGEGLPSWIHEWQFKHFLKSEWGFDSYMFGVLWKFYKFEHNGKLLLAMKYEKVGREYNWEEDTLCCDAYGRDVKFSAVKDSFEKGAELIWTNEFCTENAMPQISDCNVEDPQSFSLLQNKIDKFCQEVREAGNFMLELRADFYEDEKGETIVRMKYDYADRAKKKRTVVIKKYTMTGEETNAVPQKDKEGYPSWQVHIGEGRI